MKAMSKEEKIKEAYGEYWEKVKDFVDENGYIDGVMIKNKIGIVPNNFIEKFQPLVSMFRPKSLQGIENNRGWIKIESESDLPSEDIDCHFITHNKEIFKGEYIKSIDNFKSGSELYNGRVSHYQPITKPQPPIY
jgi:hypothetical protein